MSDYHFMETKKTPTGMKIIALIDSTANIPAPIYGGDFIIPLTAIQYKILSATHGDIDEAARIVEKLRIKLEN